MEITTLALEKRPRIPDLFLIRPPVMVPRREVFFSKMGLIDCCIELIDPLMEALSLVDRSSKGMSPGGEKPDLNFSITTLESYAAKNKDINLGGAERKKYQVSQQVLDRNLANNLR